MDAMELIEEEQKRQRERCVNFEKALSTLIEAQKNTTRNVDNLATDVKGMLKNSLHFDILEKELELTNNRLLKMEDMNFNQMKQDIKSLDKKMEGIEQSKTWLWRLIVGAIILNLVGLVYDMKLHSIAGGG
jgi:hypothetical protein